MGDPKYSRKKSARPRNPWQRNLLKEELELVGKFGLRNKKELHRASTELSRIRNQARQLLAAPTEVRTSKESILLSSLVRKGIVTNDATLDNILALNVSNILERRLQTIILQKGIARTPHQSRQLITHGHVSIGENRITIPGYIVKQNEESQIQMTEGSTFVLPEEKVKKQETENISIESEDKNNKQELDSTAKPVKDTNKQKDSTAKPVKDTEVKKNE